MKKIYSFLFFFLLTLSINSQTIYDNSMEHLKHIIAVQSLATENRLQEIESYFKANEFVKLENGVYVSGKDVLNEKNLILGMIVKKDEAIKTINGTIDEYWTSVRIICNKNGFFDSINDFSTYVTDHLRSIMPHRELTESNFYHYPKSKSGNYEKDHIRSAILYEGIGKNNGILIEFRTENINPNGTANLTLTIRSYESGNYDDTKRIPSVTKKIDFNLDLFNSVAGVNDIIWSEENLEVSDKVNYESQETTVVTEREVTTSVKPNGYKQRFNDKEDSNIEKLYDNALDHIKDIIAIQSLLAENRFDDVENYFNNNGYSLLEGGNYVKTSDINQDKNFALLIRIESLNSNNRYNVLGETTENYILAMVASQNKKYEEIQQFRNEAIFEFRKTIPSGFSKMQLDKWEKEKPFSNGIGWKWTNDKTLCYINKGNEDCFIRSNFLHIPSNALPNDYSDTYFANPIYYSGMGKNGGLSIEFFKETLNNKGTFSMIVKSLVNDGENSKKIDFNLDMFKAIQGINDVIWSDTY